jgi:hypothetical protein
MDEAGESFPPLGQRLWRLALPEGDIELLRRGRLPLKSSNLVLQRWLLFGSAFFLLLYFYFSFSLLQL